MRRRVETLCASIAASLMLSACSLAPAYHTPSLPPVPDAFKEAGAEWKTAAPADQQPHGNWWAIYGDHTLDRLETRLDTDSPSLAAALARYDTARAFESQLNAGLFPRLGALANPARNRQSDNRPLRGSNQPNEYDADTVEIGLNYDLDLWGRIRNEVHAGRALSQAAQADLATAKLSLEARLADDYVRLRGYDR